MYALDVVSDVAGLEELAPDWERLADPVGNPLVQLDWTVACARAWGAGSPLAVHVLRQDGEVVAIAALRRSPARPSRLISLFDRTAEPSYVLHRDLAAVEELLARVVRRSTLRLPRLEVTSPVLTAVKDGARRRAAVVLDRPRQTSWAPYDGGWDDFEAALSSSSRSWLRRKRRKLGQDGEVGFEAVTPSTPDAHENLRRLMDVEARSWKGREGSAIAQDPWLHQLLSTYVERASARGAVRFYFLTVGDHTVAAHLYAVAGRRIWQLKIGYDDAWAAGSPGIVLMHDVHRHACEEGLEACEYLGHAESWQQRWPLGVRDHVRVSTYPPSLAGAIHLSRDTSVHWQERWQTWRERRAEARTLQDETVGGTP